MADMREFLQEALEVGTGREGGQRKVPAFVPGGDAEDWLFDKSIQLFTENNFSLFDVRGEDGYRNALNSFSLGWGLCTEGSPGDMYSMELSENERRLMIICGSESMPRFWKHLRTNSALHIGAVFPPFLNSDTQCIVVPDAACVCALVKRTDLSIAPGVGPVNEYTSDRETWLG